MKRIFAVVLLCAMILSVFAAFGAAKQAEAGVVDGNTYPQENALIGNVSGNGEVTVDNSVFKEVTGYGSVPTVGATYSKYAGTSSEPVNKTTLETWWKSLDTTTNTITIDTAQELLLFFYGIQNASTSHTDITYTGITVELTTDIIVNEVNADGSLKTSYAGTNIASGNGFKGVFEGNGHVVQGYYLLAGSNSKGIFSKLDGATVQNVAFIDSYVDAYYESHEARYVSSTVGPQKAAALFAYASAGTTTIQNVYVSGGLDGGKASAAGLVGSAGGTLTVTNVTVDVEFGVDGHNPAEYNIGGMIGTASGTVKATNCLVNCEFTADAGLSATIVDDGTCEKIDQDGDGVVDTNEDDTGLADGKGRDMYLVDETSFDFTTAKGYGGLIGYASGALTLNNCKTTGSITAAGRGIGGIVGQLNSTATRTFNFTNCQSEVDISVLDTIYVPFSITNDTKAYYVNTGSEDAPVYERAFFDNMQSKTVTYAKGAVVNGTTLTSAQTVNAFEGVGGIVGETKGSNGTINFNSVWYSGDLDAGTRNYVGGILGAQTGKTAINFSKSTVNTFSCINTGSITANGSHVGGMLGGLWAFQTSTLKFYNCLNGTATTNGTVSGKNNIGGILGYVYSASSATFVNCQNTGSVSGDEKVGGLVGQRSGGAATTITNCNNYGTVTGTSSQIGGLVGYKGNTATMTFTECNNYGAVSGNASLGGMLGYMTQGAMYFNSCTNNAAITGKGGNIGGIAGYTAGAEDAAKDKDIVLTGCQNNSAISGTSCVGGLVGAKTQGSILRIENCENKGTVTATGECCGGLVGRGGNTAKSVDGTVTITNSVNSGVISSSSDRIAGVIGAYMGQGLYLTDCVNKGEVKSTVATKGRFVGGIAGYVFGDTNGLIEEVVVTGCKNFGNITSNRCSGGLIGDIYHTARATVTNCISDADLTFTINDSGNPYCGGLIGILSEVGEATVTGCTVNGSITVPSVTLKANNLKARVSGLIGAVRRNAVTVKYATYGVPETYGKILVNNNTVLLDKIDFDVTPNVGTYTGCSYACDALLGVNLTNTTVPEFELNTLVSSTGALPADMTLFDDDASAVTYSKRMIMKIGAQYYHDTDTDTYNLRYVFAIDELQASDAALGFQLECYTYAADGNGTPEYHDMTVYCPNVYKTLNGETETYNAEDYGAEYFFTLELREISSKEVELVNGRYMLKDTHLNIKPFVSDGDLANDGKILGQVTHTDSIAYANREQYYQNDFSATLPDAFAGAAELIPDDIRWHSDTLLNQKDGENYVYANESIMDYGCLDVKKVNDTTQATLISGCTDASEGHMCTPFDAHGVTALLTSSKTSARYHYYLNPGTVSGLNRNTAYMRFFVDTTELGGGGVYDFCFHLRLKDNENRYARVQINEQPYHEQKVLSYSPAAYANVIASNTVADATYQDSYLSGFSAELRDGINTITIRLPYNQNDANLANAWHIRNIYLVKAS